MRGFSTAFLLLSFALTAPAIRAQVPQATVAPLRWAYGEKLHVMGIPNAGKITDQLYRGAQPRTDGLKQLKKFGITTIVDLRGENSRAREREKKEAEALGIHFVSIPVSGWSAPSSDQVAQFLSLFGEDSTKVFIHCRLGEDRTGVFVAAYRMALQKWPADQAIKEMYLFGYNGFWHPGMTSYVRKFPDLLSSTPALSILNNSKSSLPAVAQHN
jgi:tyrosine-protein phosphatase SIW14